MSLIAALLAAWAVIRFAPETPVGRLFHRLMVEGPARAFNRITRGHVIVWVVLAVFAAVLIWQLEGDGVRLLSLMAPEIVSWLTMFEIGALADVAAAVFATASIARVRGFGGYVVARLSGTKPRAGRARRTRPARLRADNDDEDIGFRRAA